MAAIGKINNPMAAIHSIQKGYIFLLTIYFGKIVFFLIRQSFLL